MYDEEYEDDNQDVQEQSEITEVDYHSRYNVLDTDYLHLKIAQR